MASFTFAIYFQVVRHPFSNYDDREYVTENFKIQQGLTAATLRWALTSTEHANWHPLTWLSHALDWQLFGGSPSGHHVTSLLLHVLSVLVLFFFLAGVTQSTGRSLLVAMIFAVHPINVESVVWIAERKNVLCTLFFLLGLWAYSRYARRPNVTRYLAVALLFAFSLAAKPMAVTFPFVILLLDYWPLQRIKEWTEPSEVFPAPQLSFLKIGLEKVPLLAMSIADSAVTLIAQRNGGAIGSAVKYPLWLRLTNAIVSYVAYIWKTIWPTHLAVLYPYPAKMLPIWQWLSCALLLAAASGLIWRQRLRRRYLLVGWCWFLGMLVPVIGLIQVGEQSMADRYAYLPLIGIYLLAVWGLSDWAQQSSLAIRRVAFGVAGLALVLLSVLTWRQVRVWQNNLDLWSHAAAVTDNNWQAEDTVGSLLYVAALNSGQPYSGEAQVHFEKALQYNPDDGEALASIASNVLRQGKPQEAIEKFQLALQHLEGKNWLKAKIFGDMGFAYEQAGDYITARKYFQEALKLSPGRDDTDFVGFTRTFTDERIAKLKASLADRPTAQGYFELGKTQDSAGYADAARTSYQKALELDPKLEAARTALLKTSNGKP